MKRKNTILALIVASLFAGVAFAAESAPAAESKKGGCCAKAEKDGHACTHGCCVEAAKQGNNCAKCGGSGPIAKK